MGIMPRHTSEQRAYIVEQLAAYVSPDEIALEFAKRWKDTECTLHDIAACEPDQLDAAWRNYFDTAREKFLAAPTAERRVRIAELHRLFVIARDRRAFAQAAQLLAQIAEESSAGGDADDRGPVVEITRRVVDPAAPATSEPAAPVTGDS